MRTMLMTTVILALAMLSSCTQHADQEAPRPAVQEQATDGAARYVPQTTAVFEGTDGLEFVTSFRNDEAWVFLPEGTLQLKKVQAASGAKYSNGKVTLWTKGEEATLMREGQPDVTVHNNPGRAVWEHAKLTGADFRAVGNEPGWVLALWGDDRIVFAGDYGQSVVEFTRPEPVTDQQARTTTYTCKNQEHQLVVLLSGSPCTDSMSGESFETTVTVTLDGKEYHGCGRALH